nr:HAD domain-containing protein [Kribbella sandramycini]
MFLDVDGPLIPFGAATPYPTYRTADGSNPLLARIDPAHGERLSTLGCDLVWATTWMDDANEAISPLLGLPTLPVVTWPDAPDIPGLHWKTPGLIAWAAGRQFIWLDDEITVADRSFVVTHHPAPALLHRVDPRTGLTAADCMKLQEWLVQAGRSAG